MTMARAIFVSHTGQKGGAELFLIDLLTQAGEPWSACFLANGPAIEEARARGIPTHVVNAGEWLLAIRKGSSARAVLRGISDLFAVARDVARLAKDADVIWANSQKSLFVCAIASRLSGRPLVWGLHDILGDGSFSRINSMAAILCSRLFVRIVAVNSKASARSFVKLGGQQSKVRIIYNGFSTDTAAHDGPVAGDLRADLGLAPGSKLIGLFGRISAWKGQHVLIDALAQLPDNCHAVIVGAPLFDEGDYADRLQAQCRSLGVEGRVHFLGFRSDVQPLMRMMDIVVHTSTTPEPFGRVVAEALIAERPVVATRGGGLDEIVTEGVTGLLVDPNAPDQLASAIQRLLTDEALAGRLARDGHAHAVLTFSDTASRQAAREILALARG